MYNVAKAISLAKANTTRRKANKTAQASARRKANKTAIAIGLFYNGQADVEKVCGFIFGYCVSAGIKCDGNNVSGAAELFVVNLYCVGGATTKHQG